MTRNEVTAVARQLLDIQAQMYSWSEENKKPAQDEVHLVAKLQNSVRLKSIKNHLALVHDLLLDTLKSLPRSRT